MIIYNVLIKDRHCDPEISNFTDLVAAFNFARQNAQEYYSNYDGLKEEIYNPEMDYGWLLMIETSCEGDYIRVSQGELK